MLAAEDVERQVAIAVIVAVEEPLFLVAVERQIGGIESGHDLPGWLGESFEEQVDQEPIERVRVAVDLFLASRFGGAQFEAIQGAFAGQGLLGLAFTGEEAEEGTFSAAGGAHDGDELTGRDVEIEAAEDIDAVGGGGDGLGKSAYPDGWGGRGT